MAARDQTMSSIWNQSLVVMLTDIMDSKPNDTETPSTSGSHEDNHDSSPDWLPPVEQKLSSNLNADGSLKKKRRRRRKKKTPENNDSWEMTDTKATPRKNPERARKTSARLVDYTDKSPTDSDEAEDAEKETAGACAAETSTKRSDDGKFHIDAETPGPSRKRSDDGDEWTPEPVYRRRRQKKKKSNKYSQKNNKKTKKGKRVEKRVGVGKKKNVPEPEKEKVTLNDLEGLMMENLILAKDYVHSITSLCEKEPGEASNARIKAAKDILKHQVSLLAGVKGVEDVDILKYLVE